jgi:hypothetical protein
VSCLVFNDSLIISDVFSKFRYFSFILLQQLLNTVQSTFSCQLGIGALAGSTIMLLTIPWCLSIIGGRVDIDPRTELAK